MINFNLLNKAVCDVDLNGSAFKLLYIIANNCSINNSNSVTIHNGFLMEKSGMSERQIRNLTNELVKKGYLNKEVVGTQSNKRGNTYTLIIEDTNKGGKYSEINCTPKNNKGAISAEITAEKSAEINCPPKKNIKNKEKINIININTIEKESSKSVNFNNTSNEETYSIDNVNLDFDNSSNEESYNVPTVEVRSNNVSDNNLNEENNYKNDFINTSIEIERIGDNSNISSIFELEAPQKNAPHAPHDNRKEIDDNTLTDYFNEVFEDAKRRYNQTEDYDYGFECFEKACLFIDKNYKNINEEILISIMEKYNTYTSENKAVSDALDTSDNKSVKEGTETRQEANKVANLTINGTPIEEIYKMVTGQSIRKGAKFGYEEGLNEINRLFQGLKERYNYSDEKQKEIMIKNYHKEIWKIYPDKKVV